MNLSHAIASLNRGDVIVFPTETVYGLGADALNPAAVEKVFQLKGRNPEISYSDYCGGPSHADKAWSKKFRR